MTAGWKNVNLSYEIGKCVNSDAYCVVLWRFHSICSVLCCSFQMYGCKDIYTFGPFSHWPKGTLGRRVVLAGLSANWCSLFAWPKSNRTMGVLRMFDLIGCHMAGTRRDVKDSNPHAHDKTRESQRIGSRLEIHPHFNDKRNSFQGNNVHIWVSKRLSSPNWWKHPVRFTK